MDLWKALPDNIWIGLGGSFFRKVRCDRWPDYCVHCKLQGYTISTCRCKTCAQEPPVDSKQNTNDVTSDPTTSDHTSQEPGMEMAGSDLAFPRSPTPQPVVFSTMNMSISSSPEKIYEVIVEASFLEMPDYSLGIPTIVCGGLDGRTSHAFISKGGGQMKHHWIPLPTLRLFPLIQIRINHLPRNFHPMPLLRR